MRETLVIVFLFISALYSADAAIEEEGQSNAVPDPAGTAASTTLRRRRRSTPGDSENSTHTNVTASTAAGDHPSNIGGAEAQTAQPSVTGKETALSSQEASFAEAAVPDARVGHSAAPGPEDGAAGGAEGFGPGADEDSELSASLKGVSLTEAEHVPVEQGATGAQGPPLQITTNGPFGTVLRKPTCKKCALFRAESLLRRRVIVAQDLSDAALRLLETFRVHAGIDLNAIREDVQNACTALHEIKLNTPAVWNRAAEEALQRAADVRSLLHVPNESEAREESGPSSRPARFIKPTPSAYRRHVMDAVVSVMDTHAVPAYNLWLHDMHSPSTRRHVLRKLADAAQVLTQTKEAHPTAWDLYAQFLLTWVRLQEAKLRIQVEADNEALSTESTEQ